MRFFKYMAIATFVMLSGFAGERSALAGDDFKPGKCYDYERETVFNGNPKTSYGEVCLGRDHKWTIFGERFSNPPIDKTDSVILIVSEEGIIHVTRREPQPRYQKDRRYHERRYAPRPPYNNHNHNDDHDDDEVKDEGGMPKGLDFSR